MKTTNPTAAHTPIDQLPTPYEVSWNGPCCRIFANTPGLVTPVCEILAYSQSGKGKASTADFVALACNSHADLLAALEAAESLLARLSMMGQPRQYPYINVTRDSGLGAQAARAAIARAKGVQS